MNLYGFAGGDPVNFSDPFGLCPDPKDPHCTDTPLVEVTTNRNVVKAAAAVASVGTFGRIMSAIIDRFAGEEPQSPQLHEGRQGKHVPGHNNYVPGRSTLTDENPQGLLDDFAGTGQPVSGTRGTPGFKERVNFGKQIGEYVDPQTGVATPTSNGIIHYSKDGAHIVPARPDGY